MPGFLRQATAGQARAIGPFVDDTDFKTPETALTILNTDIKLVVNGGASANKNSGGGTHRVNGDYGVTFDATDSATVGELKVSVVVAGALPVFDKFFVLEEAVYDALFGAGAVGYVADQPVNVTKAAGTAWNSGAITAGTFGAGAIDNAAIATDAIGAAELAASAVTEIQSGLSTLDAAAVRTAVGLASANLDTQLSAIASYIDTEVAAIKAKTDNLPSDPADASDIAASFTSIASTLSTIAGYIDTEVAAIKAKTDNLPASPANEATLTTISSTLTTIAGYIDTEVAAIKAKTDNLPSDPADASDVAASFTSVASALSTIASYIDTEIAAIKAKTDNLPATPASQGDVTTAQAAIIADTEDIQSRIPAALTGGGNMKADALAIGGDTTAATRLAAHARRAVPVSFLAGGTTTTAVLDTVDGAAPSSTDDVYNGRVLIFSAPAGLKDQACDITDYNGTTKTATISAATVAVGATATAVMV